MMLFPALLSLLASPSTDLADSAPHGRYVEARTATVFAGACHYGAEYTLAGRDAVLGFQFTAGEYAGTALAGLEVVAVVSAEANLAQEGAQRRSQLFLPASAQPRQRAALEAWAREQMGSVLGSLTTVVARPLDVEVELQGSFRLEAGVPESAERVVLRGNGLPDRECCTMPFGRWYAPLVAVNNDRVGFASDFSLRVPALGVQAKRSEDNCAFFGSF